MSSAINRTFQTAAVEGFDELFRTLESLSKELTAQQTARIYNRAMTTAMMPVKQRAFSSAPRKTTQMQKMIYLKAHRPTARDKRSSTYMGEGFMARVGVGAKRNESQTHTTIYSTKRGKTVERTYIKFQKSNRPVVLANEYGTPKSGNVQAHHFLEQALNSQWQEVTKRLGNALWYELTWGKFKKEAGEASSYPSG